MSNGGFSERFIKRKKWKLDKGLLSAITTIIPKHETINDLGCGMGRYVEALSQRGYQVSGCDAADNVQELSLGWVQQCDLTSLNCFGVVEPLDWSICIEVGEHIPEEGLDQFLDNIGNSAERGLIISWAIPGQRGKDHVSCRPPEWVIEEMSIRNWGITPSRTKIAREKAGKGWDQKLLVFTGA